MKVGAISKVIIVFLIIIAAVFGSLALLGTITVEELTDSMTKVAGIGLIALVASTLVSFISSK